MSAAMSDTEMPEHVGVSVEVIRPVHEDLTAWEARRGVCKGGGWSERGLWTQESQSGPCPQELFPGPRSAPGAGTGGGRPSTERGRAAARLAGAQGSPRGGPESGPGCEGLDQHQMRSLDLIVFA